MSRYCIVAPKRLWEGSYRRIGTVRLSARSGNDDHQIVSSVALLSTAVSTKEHQMNKDQVKGAAKDTAGKVQEGAGKLVGSEEQQAKGLGKQIAGKVQKGYGDAKESLKDSNKR